MVQIEVVHLGNVGVDSGQLIITDPCYIDSESGAVVKWGEDFIRFDEPLDGYGETPEHLIASGRLVQLPKQETPDRFNYSYNGACQATRSAGCTMGGSSAYTSTLASRRPGTSLHIAARRPTAAYASVARSGAVTPPTWGCRVSGIRTIGGSHSRLVSGFRASQDRPRAGRRTLTGAQPGLCHESCSAAIQVAPGGSGDDLDYRPARTIMTK